ncbi:ubiquitination network signaling protein [Phlyctema vagabunda]|uniref:Ubiquitination network signaling protein n=1 Tax=Phlyctema vagabunda TaxID=108571 RepID=A0ABR4PPH1_9HELO
MKPKKQAVAANHRDTRHENGLVGPGKRVQKQKSNGKLANGHTKDSVPSTPPHPGTPPRVLNGHVRPSTDCTADLKMVVESQRRPSVGSYQESSSSESYQNAPSISVSHENHRRIDVNSAKNPAVHRDAGPLGLALTVLRSCPLGDTIAILIVLLQLPPTFLSIVHLLFATLTFVPPSTSPNSALNFTDIFEGTIGTPSVATIIAIDFLVLLIWILLWSPLQDLLLDLAQSVISLTLGGGTSGQRGSINNVLVCLGVIGVSHYARNGDNGKQTSLGAFLSSSRELLGSTDLDDPLEPPPNHLKKTSSAHGWIRSVLAIHILTQGLVRYIRDWYVRRERRDSSAAAIGDPEAANGALLASINDSSSTDLQLPAEENAISTAISHGVVTNKKKRKQSAQVRIRQPLWAALASTKVVMVKEYETSHAAAESVGANAKGIEDLGNAPFTAEADQVWITYVGFDEVCFSTSYFPAYNPQSSEKKGIDSSGVDKTKPFYVRVNKTLWQPTRITGTIHPDESAGQDTRWSGEIFGLAPMSSYEFDFVSTDDDSIIFSTSVRTLQAPTTDLTAATLSPNTQVQGRPGSPTTTLRTSIASSEAKLNEERARQKRERKDQRAKINSSRKEIDRIISNIASSGGNDDRLRQKVLQSKLHMKQAEDALAQLASQIESLETVPTDDSSEWKYEKEAFQSQRDLHKQSRQDYNNAKSAAERDIQALTNEVAALQQKRERMQGRIAKLNGEHERITDANAKGLDEAQRKAREREAKEVERANLENLYIQRSQDLTAEIQEIDATCQHSYNLINSLQEALYVSQSPSAALINPQNPYDIPEGNMVLNNYSPWNPPPPFYPGTTYAPTNNHGTRTRGRSSSMLSDISGFTDFDDSQQFLPPFGEIGQERQRSEDTSSSSSSDPRSPVVGTIGPTKIDPGSMCVKGSAAVVALE